MKLNVLNRDGKDTGRQVELPDSIFSIEPHDHSIYLSVKAYLANQRQGTHKNKNRNEVAGSTRKLHRQKGTGGSRKGSIKNPLYRQGGSIHGPQPRDYTQKVNKKVNDLARKSALTYKAKENNLLVVEDLSMSAPKTKDFAALLKNLGVAGKCTTVLGANEKNVVLSARNMPKTSVVLANNLSCYDVMNAGKLILTESSVKTISEQLN